MGNLKIMIWICIFLLYFQQFVDCTIFPSFTKLPFHHANATGPESLAFDPIGGGPYAGVADGRILKYEGPQIGFLDFATTSPSRTTEECDGTNGVAAERCGRPSGFGFDYRSGDLYVLDSNFGFQVIPPVGGLGIPLATGFNGTKFSLPNALDIDQATQNVYFTDSGRIFLTMNMTEIIRSRDTSGKLFKYNIKTARLTLLLSGLSGPTGLAVSKDGSYLVISEFIRSRIRRFWLRGPRAYRAETLMNLPGSPDNIKRTVNGDFWVAVAVARAPPVQRVSALGIKFNGFGRILESLDLTAYYNGTMITEVQEHFKKLYIASAVSNFVGVYEVKHLTP